MSGRSIIFFTAISMNTWNTAGAEIKYDGWIKERKNKAKDDANKLICIL